MISPETLYNLRHHPDADIADTEAQEIILALLDDLETYKKRVEQDAERIRVLRVALRGFDWDCHHCGYVGEPTGKEYCVHCGEEFPPPKHDTETGEDDTVPCECGSYEYDDSCPECGHIDAFGAVDTESESWATRIHDWHQKVMLEREQLRADLTRMKAESLRIVQVGDPCLRRRCFKNYFTNDGRLYANTSQREICNDVTGEQTRVEWDDEVQPVSIERWS